MPATLDAARAGVTTGEWAAALRAVFGEYRAPTGVGDAAAAPTDDALTALRDRVEEVSAALGPADQDPRGQAGPRRALERRRADRGARPRRGHGRGLRGHPAHAGADRPHGGRRGRARGRPLDPVRLARRADPDRARRAARGRRRRAGRGRRDHPARRRGRAPRGGRGARLHAEGLRGQPDHGRHRLPRRRAPRRRAAP